MSYHGITNDNEKYSSDQWSSKYFSKCKLGILRYKWKVLQQHRDSALFLFFPISTPGYPLTLTTEDQTEDETDGILLLFEGVLWRFNSWLFET